MSTTILRLAIGATLQRIANQKTHIYIIRAIMAISLIFGVAFSVMILLQCRPIWYFWSLSPSRPEHCQKPVVLIGEAVMQSVVNIIVDWFYAIFPFFLIRKANMNRRTKISVMAILAFGSM